MGHELISQVKLSLFDIVLYIDDSGSMAFEEGGERIDDLKLYVFHLTDFRTADHQYPIPSRLRYLPLRPGWYSGPIHEQQTRRKQHHHREPSSSARSADQVLGSYAIGNWNVAEDPAAFGPRSRSV